MGEQPFEVELHVILFPDAIRGSIEIVRVHHVVLKAHRQGILRPGNGRGRVGLQHEHKTRGDHHIDDQYRVHVFRAQKLWKQRDSSLNRLAAEQGGAYKYVCPNRVLARISNHFLVRFSNPRALFDMKRNGKNSMTNRRLQADAARSIARSQRNRSAASIRSACHSSSAFPFRTTWNGNPYETSIRKSGSAGATPKSCRFPPSAAWTTSMATSFLANATMAATIRRTMPRRKLPARTSTTMTSASRVTSSEFKANAPAGGSDVNERKSRSPRKSAPTWRSESTDRSSYREYRYQRSVAWRGWNAGGTSEYAQAQTPSAWSLKTPTTASPWSAASNAITFPTALTPRSVRLALRKKDSRGFLRILPARNAARHSPSTVRRSGWRWWPKNAPPSYAILRATRMPRNISCTIYRAHRADDPRRPRGAEERGECRGRRAGHEELRRRGSCAREALPAGCGGAATGDAGDRDYGGRAHGGRLGDRVEGCGSHRRNIRHRHEKRKAVRSNLRHSTRLRGAGGQNERPGRARLRPGRLRSPRRGTAAMRPADDHSGIPGVPDSQPLACGNHPALRTPRGESHQAREARSIRHGEGEAPRGVRVIACRDGLSGAQTSAHPGHVSSTHRPRGPEQVGVPCAYGRDPAGDETDSALGTQGLADAFDHATSRERE